METPSKEQLLEDLRLSEEEIKAQPNVTAVETAIASISVIV
jgi:hypothetical protein